MASDEEEIRRQIQQIREHSDTISSLYYELESAISDLQSNMQELAENRTANQVTLKPAYTGTAETGNGYKAEYTVSITDWIRASEEDALQLAWENSGGKDTVPSMDNFHEHTNDGFSTQNAAVAFGTISFRNITEGYDITESNPIAFTVPLQTDKDVTSGKMGYVKLYIGYTEPKYIDLWEYPSISCLMKRNTWGPVVLMFVFPDAFTPNNPQGHPGLDGYKIYFENGYYTGDKCVSISYPAGSDNINTDNENDG